jgi:chemotaxis protein MotB
MARKKKHEEHVNAEAWAIPYGDLITLLLAFFVVMYSMSSVNEGKLRVLSDSLISAFQGSPMTIASVDLQSQRPSFENGSRSLSGTTPTTLTQPHDRKPGRTDRDAGTLSSTGLVGTGAGHVGRGSDLTRMASAIRAAMQKMIDSDDVRVRQTPLWLEIEIGTDILFGSGVAQVSAAAEPVLRELAEILKPFPNPVRVEGHTDNRPIRTAVFPSNWELSAARAANVVQLFTTSGIEPGRMEVTGYGEFRPVAPNTTDAGRNRNRRVLIVVMERPDPADPAPGAIPSVPAAPPVPPAVSATPPAGTAAAAAPSATPPS